MGLKVKVFDNGKSKYIALIHGWGFSSVVFEDVAKGLANEVNVILVDMPGYGINESLGVDSFDYEGFISDLHAVLPRDCYILGWSLGGMIALDYATRFPTEIRGLITVCSSPRFIDDVDKKNCNLKIWKGMPERTLKAFNRLLKPTNKDQICEKFLALQAMGSKSIRKDIRSLRKTLKSQKNATYVSLVAGLKLLCELDLRPSAKWLCVPSLHLLGKYDRLVSSENVAEFWYNHKMAEVRIFSNTSHNPFLTEYELFIKEIAEFLNNN